MINSIILAAGKGTRMKSSKPKVTHKVLGTEMVNLVLRSMNNLGATNNLVVVGYKKEDVISSLYPELEHSIVEQHKQLGTGDAIKSCKEYLQDQDGITFVVSGDTPIITDTTYKNLLDYHKENNFDMTVLTTDIKDPFGYGRIIREGDRLEKIVEQKDATSEEKKVLEINSGIYIFDNKKLFELIDLLDNNNAQEEYYLTDMVKIFIDNNLSVGAYKTLDHKEIIGVNDLVTLSKVNHILKKRINNQHMLNGVQLVDKHNTYIGINVVIEEDVLIYPGNQIYGQSTIRSGTVLKPNNTIVNSEVGHDCEIGPMCYLRKNTEIGDNCRFGNFVEAKNTKIKSNTTAAHLTYLGDAEIGSNVNLGCGVITCNYDGVNKHKTTIGDNVFVGSNTNLIAPISIDDNVFIAAGATVSDDVSKDKFIIQRADTKIKDKK